MKLRKLLAQLFRRNESICWDPGEFGGRLRVPHRNIHPKIAPQMSWKPKANKVAGTESPRRLRLRCS
jgi:hypothetical protein